jgi:hypothetical protein
MRCTWEWDLRGGGNEKDSAGRGNGNDRTLAEHTMTVENGNGLCGEGGMGMIEHIMAAYPLPP